MSLEAQLSTGQWRSVPCDCFHGFVDHQYSWFGRIPSAVANRYRKSASLLKRSVSISSITEPIKLANIAFQSVPCINDEWAILGDDVGTASRRLNFLLKYRDGALNIPMIGLYYVQMWK